MFEEINYYGLLLGVVAFLIIGLFHPLVIKAEYYFSKKIWLVFLLLGIGFSVSSIFFESDIVSLIFGVLGFSSFWSVLEVIEQHKRVVQGRAKKNPKRNYD